MFLLVMVIPFTYGVLYAGMTAAVVGAMTSGVGLTLTWLGLECRQLKKRLAVQREFTRSIERLKSEVEDAYMVVEGDLVASQQINEDFLKEFTLLNKMVAEGRTKDAMIQAQKRRIANINAEYNNKCLPHRVTTMADVHKLTGEEGC